MATDWIIGVHHTIVKHTIDDSRLLAMNGMSSIDLRILLCYHLSTPHLDAETNTSRKTPPSPDSGVQSSEKQHRNYSD
jgi:hypothetical protein